MSKEEKTGKKSGLSRSEGHLHCGEVLHRSEGYLATAKSRAKMATPRVRYSIAVLCRSEALHCGEGTVHTCKNFPILFQKPHIRAAIV